MIRRNLIVLVATLPLVACAGGQPQRTFEPSSRSAVELRSMQTRLYDGNADWVTRGVIATLHDLGYRITKAEPGAGTLTATKLNTIRLTAVIRARDAEQTVVRANATVLRPNLETQVDDPRFYTQFFFAPLTTMLGREAFAVPADTAVPEAVRPALEVEPGRRFHPPSTPPQEPAP